MRRINTKTFLYLHLVPFYGLRVYFCRYSFIHATLRISWYSYEFSEETHEILFTNLLIIGFHGNSIHTVNVKIKYIRGFLIRESLRCDVNAS